MPRLFRAVLAAVSLAAILALPTTIHAASPTKVAIIVGPVGSLTPTYLALADAAAAAAQQHGAVVARAYSPHATPANVLAAVADAHVVIYFGHGYGHPSPYGGLNTAKQNGWALQGPGARGTHGDAGSQIQYYGEDWIAANARPAPGFVMIYSNTCYAPGASEGGHAPANPWTAAQRVAHYSRSVFAMGGSAYFATDFDRGAADLVGRLLRDRGATFGSAFVSDHRYVPSALTSQAHPFSAGQTIWLHRSKYTKGPPNYWYAFAGNPDLSPLRAWDRIAPTATIVGPTAEIGPDQAITLRLSEPVTGIDDRSLQLHDAGGVPVAASVVFDATSRTATITPAQPLALSARYSVVAGDGILDAAGRALAATSWTVSTRLDADPLSAEVPIVLEAGAHQLLRIGADGSVEASRTLEVVDRRWTLADRRARLVGKTGSWLRLDDAVLGGWWVAESGRAHALGVMEDARLSAGTQVTLPPLEHTVHRFDASGLAETEQPPIAGGSTVSVDRRRVFEGRTFLRLQDGAAAGAWIETNPTITPTEASARRVIDVQTRVAEARIVPGAGDRAIFMFDAAGRVSERRTLADADARSMPLTTTEIRVVGGARFAIIASGELAGWALAEAADLHLLPITIVPDSAG